MVALGDADAEFTIPSMSKPFVFALALETLDRDRNRAFGHLLRSYDLVRGDVSDAVEAYFRQCSVRVTVADTVRVVLDGELSFSGAERVLAALRTVDLGSPDQELVVDLSAPTQLHPAALVVLHEEMASLGGRIHVDG